MQSLLLTILMMVAPVAFADSLGKKVEIYAEGSGPRFSTLFSYDADKMWMLTMTLWGRDLAPDNVMRTLAWRLYDSKSRQFIGPWKNAVNNSEPTLYPGTLAFSLGLIDELEIVEAIKGLPTLKVVIAVDQNLAAPVPTHYVDLGSLCGTNPQNFVDLSSGGTGCRAKSPGAKLNTF